MFNFAEILEADLSVEFSKTQAKILKAAVRQIESSGVNKLALEDVAKAAGVNRTTIYRSFQSKENLLVQLAVFEGRRLIEIMKGATRDCGSAKEILIEGFIVALRFSLDHPIIARTAKYEPQVLVNIGVANDSALLRLGAGVLANVLREAQEQGLAQHIDADSAGDAAARLFASFVLMEGGVNHLNTEERIRNFAENTWSPLFLGIGA